MNSENKKYEEEDMNNKTERIHPRFHEEVKEIIEDRLKKGIDKKKKSFRYISGLIIRNGFWENMKQEIKEFEENDEE